MKPLFSVAIALLDDGSFGARTICHEDGMTNQCSAKRLPVLMKTVSLRIGKRRQHNVKFPVAEKRIISPNGNGAPRLIVTAHN